jgi:phenol hydroxylase P4 protein
MPVNAITPNYVGELKDDSAKFGDNILLMVNWLEHLLFEAPLCFPVPKAMTFQALCDEVLNGAYSLHPDWEKVDLKKAVWELDEKPFTPDYTKTLAQQGIGHKSMLRFETPGLKGIGGIGY